MDKEEMMKQMDRDAVEAAKELEKLPADAVSKVAEWWRKWYPKAGHKRLGRLMAAK